MKSKEIRLHNLIFPAFMLVVLSPVLWGVILAANFVIDSLVLWIGCALWKPGSFVQIWKQSILRVVCFGFLADFLGSLFLSLLYIGLSVLMNQYAPGLSGPFEFYFWPGCALWALPGIALSGFLVYFFDRKYAFLKTGLDAGQIRRLALLLGIATAPYIMALPMDVWRGLHF